MVWAQKEIHNYLDEKWLTDYEKWLTDYRKDSQFFYLHWH